MSARLPASATEEPKRSPPPGPGASRVFSRSALARLKMYSAGVVRQRCRTTHRSARHRHPGTRRRRSHPVTARASGRSLGGAPTHLRRGTRSPYPALPRARHRRGTSVPSTASENPNWSPASGLDWRKVRTKVEPSTRARRPPRPRPQPSSKRAAPSVAHRGLRRQTRTRLTGHRALDASPGIRRWRRRSGAQRPSPLHRAGTDQDVGTRNRQRGPEGLRPQALAKDRLDRAVCKEVLRPPSDRADVVVERPRITTPRCPPTAVPKRSPAAGCTLRRTWRALGCSVEHIDRRHRRAPARRRRARRSGVPTPDASAAPKRSPGSGASFVRRSGRTHPWSRRRETPCRHLRRLRGTDREVPPATGQQQPELSPASGAGLCRRRGISTSSLEQERLTCAPRVSGRTHEDVGAGCGERSAELIVICQRPRASRRSTARHRRPR